MAARIAHKICAGVLARSAKAVFVHTRRLDQQSQEKRTKPKQTNNKQTKQAIKQT
jgi:hypothetical protein